MSTSPQTNVKVTVGVCVKNCASIIEETVNSILTQDYPHKLMEIIFVDDGSEDDTISIIKRYLPELDISTRIFHHSWKGLGASRSVVVDNANGKYIAWVDGDMTLPPEFLRQQVEFMDNHPKVGVAKGKYCLTAQENLVGDLENMEFAISNLRRTCDENSIPLGSGGSIYRVKAVKEIGGFDRNITGSGEDMDVEQRIRSAGWFLEVTSAVFYERRRKTWKSLWKEYFWHGQGGSFLIKQRKQVINLFTLFPLVAFKNEMSRVIVAYKLTGRTTALLLPLHYFFKRVAWITGFARDRFLGKSEHESVAERVQSLQDSESVVIDRTDKLD
jgi:glycosyltransferase involved in cell wall biosynthesis